MTEVPEAQSAAYPSSDRFSPPKAEDAPVMVVVEGQVCPAKILGLNGPRVQVRFTRDGASFVRWFDRADLRSMTDSADSAANP